MSEHRQTLADSTERIAALAATALEEELSPGEGKRDTKQARDLSAILKDMTALHRELSAEEKRREVSVRFDGDAAAAAE